MKKTFNYIVLAAMALCAVACSQDDLATSYLSDSRAVHISAQIGENYVSGEFGTRSNPMGTGEEQTKFNAGDKIAVAAGNQDEVVYTLDANNAWMPDPTKYLVWETEMMGFGAYYPVGVNGSSSRTFNQPTSYGSITDLANADYMTFSGDLSNTTSNSVTLQMKRKMARLIIKTSFKDQFESGYEVSSIRIHSNASGYVGGAVQSSEEGTEITAYKYEGNFYALLVPTSLDADKTFLTVTVKKVDDVDTEKLTVIGIPATQDGYSYEMTVVVGKDKASIGEVKVSDWKTGKIIEGTAVELVPSVDAESHTVVTTAEEQLNDALLSEALGDGNMLVIEGPLASQDISTISTFIKNKSRIISLDMAKAKIGTIPESAFESNAYLGKTKLPTKLKAIGDRALNSAVNCTIENFNDLETLETIGGDAFGMSGITSITFPQNITDVKQCFRNCESLVSVKFEGDVQSLYISNAYGLNKNGCTFDLSQTSSVPNQPVRVFTDKDYERFENYDKDTKKFAITLLVKKGLKTSYETHNYWKYFTIEEAK